MSNWLKGEVLPMSITELADALVYRLASVPAGQNLAGLARFTNALELSSEESQRAWTILRCAIDLARAGDHLLASNLIWAAFPSGARVAFRVSPAEPHERVARKSRATTKSKRVKS